MGFHLVRFPTAGPTRHDYIIEKVDGEPITFDQFNSYRWVRDQEYEFTIRLPIGILTTLRSIWPLQYNQK